MPDHAMDFTTAERIVEEGKRLYAERHQVRLERETPGAFVAIDVLTGNAYTGRYPEDAMKTAQAQAPSGLFHLIRVGSVAAYSARHLPHGHAVAG